MTCKVFKTGLGAALSLVLLAGPALAHNPLAGIWQSDNGTKWTIPDTNSDPFTLTNVNKDGSGGPRDGHWIVLGSKFWFKWGAGGEHKSTVVRKGDGQLEEVTDTGNHKFWVRVRKF